MKKVIKRDGSYVEFDKTKISNAILKAMKNGVGTTNYQVAYDIANEIEQEFKNQNKDLSIYSIEEHVFDSLVEKGQILTARAYEGYRSIREFQRKNSNTTDQEVKELLSGTSEYWNEENSNKIKDC